MGAKPLDKTIAIVAINNQHFNSSATDIGTSPSVLGIGKQCTGTILDKSSYYLKAKSITDNSDVPQQQEH